MTNDFDLSNGTRVHLIGDPHLGKKFEVGVAPHRRGEREASQAAHYANELQTDADVIVMVGDLFDNPYVSDAAIVAAARATLGAAERNSDVIYVMMAGNHDKPRDLNLVGAWHSFREMTQDRLDNLVILDRPGAIDGVAFFPWEWDRRAEDQVADLVGLAGIEHAVGHWDLSVFDGKDSHLAPLRALRAAFGDAVQAWSGHYHRPGIYPVDDGTVNCVGSMEPYTHAEDPEGKLYVTLSREDALSRASELHDMYVRILLAPGEDMPEVDCLGLTHKRVQAEAVEEKTVSIDDFDFHRIVRERIQNRDPRVREAIEERMSLNAPVAEE